MSDLKEKVAYLHGLAEGMEISNSTKEGRVIAQMIEVLKDIVNSIDDLNEQQKDMEKYIDSIDGDLSELEEEFYQDEDEDDEDDEDEADYVEVKCPGCDEVVCFDAAILDDEDLIEVTCPSCNEVVYVNDGSYDECCEGHECCCSKEDLSDEE